MRTEEAVRRIGYLKRLKEIKTDEKNDTYFLLAAEQKAIDYSRI